MTPLEVLAILGLIFIIIVVFMVACYVTFVYIKDHFSGYDRLIECLKKVEGNENSEFMNFGYWDETTTSLPEANRNLCDFIISKTTFGSDTKSILDVGCGYGDQDLYLYPKIKTKITCFDINPKQINSLEEIIKKDPELAGQLTTQTGDAVQMPFETASFDMVWSFESAFHYNTRVDFFEEASRVLRPGGRLLIADIVLNKKCPRIFSYIPQKICQSFFSVCDENARTGCAEWTEQLETIGNFRNIQTYDITDQTFKPYFKFFYSNFQHYRGSNIFFLLLSSTSSRPTFLSFALSPMWSQWPQRKAR